MLRLKVYINDKLIDEIKIRNLGLITNPNRTILFHSKMWQYIAYDMSGSVYKNGNDYVKVEHNRKKGWKNLVIKALRKLLREEKK